MKKKSTNNHSFRNKNADKKGAKQFTKTEIGAFSLIEPDRWIITSENNKIQAYDKERMNDFMVLNKHLKCMYSGLVLGEMKGKDFIPSANIALSKKLNKTSIETVDVDYDTAIRFLRKDAILLTDSILGYVLVCYKGLGLGWVKNLGNRCNNLYPQEWRIRMKI